MRLPILCVALGLATTSAKREPAFVPADDETLDPSLNYTPIKSVNYHGILAEAGRQPVLMAYLDDSLENYEEVRDTYNRAVATFGCLAPDRNYMMASGKEVRARFIVSEDDITMPSLSIFRRKRQVTFAGNWTEAELRVWVYKELTGLEFVEEDAEYDAFVKTADKTTVRACLATVAWSVRFATDPHTHNAACALRRQVAFVEQFCDAKSAEFTKVLAEHRENVKTNIPAGISRNHELAKILGMETATGLVVVAGRGKGPRTLFPENTMQWRADELHAWMMGVFGTKAKFRNTDEL